MGGCNLCDEDLAVPMPGPVHPTGVSGRLPQLLLQVHLGLLGKHGGQQLIFLQGVDVTSEAKALKLAMIYVNKLTWQV